MKGGTAQRLKALGAQGAGFAFVGMLCFVVDAKMTVELIKLGAGPYLGRAIGFCCANAASWYLNRSITFRKRRSLRPVREFVGFFVANLPGALLNYGIFATCVAFRALEPVPAIAVGAVAGMICNFTLARWLIFRPAVLLNRR
jgi:putative flippase GtrA